MYNDSLKIKLCVLFISFMIVGIISMIFFFDYSSRWDLSKIVSCIVASIWGFFLAPTVKYIINWFKTLSFEQAFYAGFRIGYQGIFVLVALSPIIGTMYYLNKKFKTNGNNKNIIMVGWYIL